MLVVVATDRKRVEFYAKHRPVGVPVATDPDRVLTCGPKSWRTRLQGERAASGA